MQDIPAQDSSFASVIDLEIVQPLGELCELLADEERVEELAFFSNLMEIFKGSGDEAMVLAGVFELSTCAFLGFSYSPAAQLAVEGILDRAIVIAHTMSAE
jgi:hypothetical protein